MNKERIEQLNQFLSENPEVKEKLDVVLNESGKETGEKIAKVLSAVGFEILPEDLKEPSGELSDDELGTVAGGGGCGCFAYGSGAGDGLCCDCFAGGSGGVSEEFFNICGDGGCICVAAGAGATNFGN